MDNRQILSDIISQVQSAINNKAAKWEITYDISQNVFIVKNDERNGYYIQKPTYHSAVIEVAYWVLDAAKGEISLKR